MLYRRDLWLMDEELSLDERSDVLRTMPEIRQLLARDRQDDQLGLRSILERPELLSRSWWHTANLHRHRSRHLDALRAA
jgi:hypothetical protein